MLKETFKMRKIRKHLVNVSMLSLAIAPVVVSGVQPVFAEERVMNAETISTIPPSKEKTIADMLTDAEIKKHLESTDIIVKRLIAKKINDSFKSLSDGYVKARLSQIDGHKIDSTIPILPELTINAPVFSENDIVLDYNYNLFEVQSNGVFKLKNNLTNLSMNVSLKPEADRKFVEYYNKVIKVAGAEDYNLVSASKVFTSVTFDPRFESRYVSLESYDDMSLMGLWGSRVGQAHVTSNTGVSYVAGNMPFNLVLFSLPKLANGSTIVKGSVTQKFVGTDGVLLGERSTGTVPAGSTITSLTHDAMIKYNGRDYKFLKQSQPDVDVVSKGDVVITYTYTAMPVTPVEPVTEVLEKRYQPNPNLDPGVVNVVDPGSPKRLQGNRVIDPGKPQVIDVGTKPKVVEEDIPFKEEVRENPKLPKGTENVIQEGEKGKKTTTTTYTLDDKTGKVTSTEKVTTKDPKNRIIERGTGEDKDGDLIVNYIPDPENEPGKQTIVDEGKKPKLDVTGKVKDSGKPKVIKVGTKPKVVEEDIPFKEEVRENPKLPKGTENVIQEGEKGKKTTTTTYTVDPKTGDVIPTEKVTTKDPKNRIIERGTGEDKDGDLVVNYIPDPENEPGKQTIVDEGKKPKLDVTGKVKDPGKPKVIKVGTKPKVVEEDVPFKEEVRENPKLPKGTENVIQEGEKGKKKTMTTYTLDEKTGKVTSTEKVETKDPKNRIIERGTGEDKDGDLVVNYIPDPENEPGKQTIVDEGKKPKLDVTGKVKDPGKPKVIKVGTKPKVVEEDIPFKEEVRENPKLPEGAEFVIQEGEKGKKKTTTTYALDPKTGKVTSTDKVETKDPKNRIIERGTGKDVDGDIVVTYIPDPEDEPGKQTIVDEGVKPKLDVNGKVKDPGKPKVIKVGTKPKVVDEDIPFKEEVRENPKLPKGTENVIQEGENGKKTTTTTYTMDPKTGEVTFTDKVEIKDPKNRIIERGTGEDKDGDLIVKYIPDPEEEPGKQTVVDEGKKPKFDVTGKELDPGSPKVIKVGTKPKVVEEELPFKEEVRENPELPEGERKVVQEGKVGKKITTTTYTLDEKTGEVKESITEKVDEPKVQIVEVGTKKPEALKEEPKVETPKTTEAPKKEEPKVEEPKAKETPKQLPKTNEQMKQRNTVIVALLSVVGLGGLVTYLGLRKREDK